MCPSMMPCSRHCNWCHNQIDVTTDNQVALQFTAACADPPDIANGQWTISSEEVPMMVTYACESGYVLSNTEPRRCNLNGQWDHPEPVCCKYPECINYLIF